MMLDGVISAPSFNIKSKFVSFWRGPKESGGWYFSIIRWAAAPLINSTIAKGPKNFNWKFWRGYFKGSKVVWNYVSLDWKGRLLDLTSGYNLIL